MKKLKYKPMKEIQYRSSRICRVLGNPTAYKIIRLLENKKLSPSEISQKLNLSIQTISDTLRILRKVDLVRYDTWNKRKVYFLKVPQIIGILNKLEKLVDKLRFQKW